MRRTGGRRARAGRDEGTTTLEVSGVTFTHGRNGQQEYYEHRDGRGWHWILLRNISGREAAVWTAHLIAGGRNGGQRALDTMIVRDGRVIEKDPLADVNKYDLRAMLDGIAGLVKIGKWPETLKVDEAA
ncbi:MAG TPA: hypothetical protein VGB98_19380 [Pyrinomonadaceae bacterium]